MQLRALYAAMKPGIMYGNLLHFGAGLLLAFQVPWSWAAASAGAAGTALVIAAACLINNYFDRDIDAHMKRTKKRPTVTGQISPRLTWASALLLGGLGIGLLYVCVNPLTTLLALVALVSYAGVYTYAKRVTIHSTLIGTVPGALPTVAGYTTLSGQLDTTALLIFLVIVAWQMPHFFAIALFRKSEYAAAKLPVVTSRYSDATIRRWIIGWIAVYLGALLALCYQLNAFVLTMLLVAGGVWWLVVARRPYSTRWPRQVFGSSLVLSVLFFAAAAVNFVI